MAILYADVTNCSNLSNISVQQSHNSATASAQIECVSTSLDIGDSIEVDLGYTTNHAQIFSGYVKAISKKVKDNTYIVTAQDELVRAVDYFVVSSNPDTPFSRHNIEAGALIKALFQLAGLNSFNFSNSAFYLAVTDGVNAEVNLVGAYDYAKSVADLLAWSIWADENGTVYFKNRKPYVMDGTSGQVGDVADSSIGTLTNPSILEMTFIEDERDLRNRVVVYGSEGVYAEASSATSYDSLQGTNRQILPSGFYKSAAAASPLINSVSIAQDAADYNLELYNRLGQTLTATVLGDPTLKAREVITVTQSNLGISSKDFYIYMAEHSWGKNGYIVNLQLRR